MGDLRYAVRLLSRSPGFTLFTAALLAIGIGGNAIIFTALNAVLLRPLPVLHPEQLVRMVQKVPQLGTRSYFSYAFYRALSSASKSFSHVFGEYQIAAVVSSPGAPAQVRLGLVTPEYFDALGVAPLHGRALNRASVNEAVLSYEFWKTRFNGDPRAIGRGIVLNRRGFVITGIMPRDFNGISLDAASEIRIPLSALQLIAASDPDITLDSISLDLAARMRPGISIAQAHAETLSLWRPVTIEEYKRRPNLTAKDLEIELRRGVLLDPLEHGVSIVRDKFGAALRLLAGAVGLLLILLCANIAALIMARNAGRREEIMIRLAIGATRARLLRQMLVETVVLTAGGAIAGIALAYAVAPLLSHALPPVRDLATHPLLLTIDFTPDWRVLLFAAAASLVTALLFGLPPAITASRASIEGSLRQARSTASWKTRQTLVVLQIGLCTLLLAGAALLVRTFEHLRAADPGFDRDHIVVFSAEPYLSGYSPAQTAQLTRALQQRIRAMPDVKNVATAAIAVMRGSGMKMTVAPTGQRTTRADFLNTSTNAISPEYFDTMGIRVLSGRALYATDASEKHPVNVVVNEAFVQRFFRGADPVGRTLGQGLERVVGIDFNVVGVVSDAKYRSLREPMTPTLYTVSRSSGTFQLIVRTRGRPESVIQPVRDALRFLDPALPFTEIRTLAEDADASTAAEQTTAEAASLFAAVAAILSAIGVYSLLAYAVTQRRREIGIRMALGARPGQVGSLLVRQALAMALFGIGMGLAAAAVIGPLLQPVLYGVQSSDIASRTSAAVLVLIVAALGTAIPTARAARVEPAAALRTDA